MSTDSLRSSWWLFTHHKLDTFVFALVMGLVALGVGLVALLAAVVLALPGAGLLIAGLATGAVGLAVAGVVVLLLLAGVALMAALFFRKDLWNAAERRSALWAGN